MHRHLYAPDMPDPDLARAHVGRVPDLELPAVAARVLASSSSPTCCGPTSAASTSSTRSPSSNAATAASAPCNAQSRSASVSTALSARSSVNYTGVTMPGLYRDEGVVLRTIKLGEADRIVTIFTQGHGKVRAVAKGDPQDDEQVRRPARADEPGRAAVLPGPRARRRHPGRDDRVEPGAARGLRVAHARDPDARSRRPGRAGARAEPGAVPHAHRRAAHARRDAAPRSSRPRSSGSCCRSKASTRCSTAAPAAATPSGRRRRRAGRVRPRRGRHAVPGVRAGRRPSGLARRARPVAPRCSAAGSNGVLAEAPGPGRARGRAARHPGARAPRRAPPALDRRCSRPPVSRRSEARRDRTGRPSSLARYGRRPLTPS